MKTPPWLIDFAQWLGFAVMVAGGVFLALGIAWLAVECAWRMHKKGANLGDVFDAVTEFRKNHPERYKDKK
ncbi:MAG TPA: hypothetical protein VK642_06295 [Burkholderiales bacterium]|nr:hypothetical protein [Burkholderiales bacterium]